MSHSIISVFGSAYPTVGSPAYEQGRMIGERIAEQGWTVCNGGYGGIMEASARGAVEAGGTAIGVTSEYYKSTANRFVTEEIKTKNVVERLLRLIELAQGYIVLPGGTGTLTELATVWEYINKGVITPRPIIAYKPFWKPVVDTINSALIEEGKEDRTAYVQMFDTPEEAIELLKKEISDK
jgi:uncharacterized protein (TIGR00730 family)